MAVTNGRIPSSTRAGLLGVSLRVIMSAEDQARAFEAMDPAGTGQVRQLSAW
jgi:hypothetical protein